MYSDWLSAIKSHALSEALAGKNIKGWKLVEGRSVRTITDEEKAVEILVDMGYTEEELKNHKLKGIGDLEKLLGKKVFSARFGDAIESRPGAPKLVPESAKGVEYSPLCDFDVEG